VTRRVLIIVQNLPVTFDRRVWLECHALSSTGYQVAVVCPVGRGDPAHQVIDSVELRDELSPAGHVELTARSPDELVARILSTADVPLSADQKNPLNDVSKVNKTMDHMASELPVVAFDLRETRVSAREAA
jgi:hypothetical protein